MRHAVTSGARAAAVGSSILPSGFTVALTQAPWPMPQCCTMELWRTALAAQEWQAAGSTDFQEGYAQLHIAQLLLPAEGLPAALPAALQQRAQHAVCSIWDEATESRLHREVSAALCTAGMEHCIEFTPEASLPNQ